MGDPTSPDFPSVIPPNSIDTALMVFFLSAVSLEKMPAVLQKVCCVLTRLLVQVIKYAYTFVSGPIIAPVERFF